MKKIYNTYPLNVESVDTISTAVRDFLKANDVTREIYLRMGLVIEETLIALLEECEEGIPIELILSNKIGQPWVTIKYPGKRVDPTKGHYDGVSDVILHNLGITPVWNYRFEKNRITFKVPSSGVKMEILLVGAVILAVLLGLAGGVIPDGIKGGLIAYVLMPLSEIFMNLLATMAPMLIFLSIINSIIKGGEGSDFNMLGRYIIGRYIGVTAIMVVVFTGLLIPFYHLNFEMSASAASSFDKLYELVMNIVPRNIILPFSENNTIQIIILALILGTIILNLDNQVNGLRSTVTDFHIVFMNATEAICTLLPIFVFASLTKLFWENGFGTFAKLWKPILAAVIVEYGFIALMSIFLGLQYKVNPLRLLKKLMPSFLVGLTTGSSLAAYTRGMEVNKDGLGISEDYSRLAYPLGISLYVATYAPLYIAITYYMAEIYQTPTSFVWYGTVALICMILAYASPQVSGGALICLGILMTQLKIPSEGIAIAGTISLALDFFSTGAKVLGQHLEMLYQAGHLGMLDKEILRR